MRLPKKVVADSVEEENRPESNRTGVGRSERCVQDEAWDVFELMAK